MRVDRNNPQVARKIVERLLPDARIRKVSLQFLGNAIREAHSLAPSRWGVTLTKGMLRLNVGRIETLAIFANWLHVVLYRDGKIKQLDKLGDIDPNPRARTLYRSVPRSFARGIPSKQITAALPLIEASHRNLTKRAAITARNGSTVRAHSPGILLYLQEFLGSTMPDPSYSISGNGEPIDAPDIDDVAISGSEGRKKWVQHFRRERNRNVIAAKKRLVLAATGRLECEACDFNFATFYRPHADDFCEVHHRKPLAELKKETKTRLRDLAILCSNCHRVIHLINPMPSVEKFAALLKRRKL